MMPTQWQIYTLLETNKSIALFLTNRIYTVMNSANHVRLADVKGYGTADYDFGVDLSPENSAWFNSQIKPLNSIYDLHPLFYRWVGELWTTSP